MGYQEYQAAEIAVAGAALGLSLSASPEDWNRAAEMLWKSRDWAGNFERRVHRFYLPMYFWCSQERAKVPLGRNYFVGINGPQGCGKSTLAAVLADCFSLFEAPATAISIDDFYKTRSELEALAVANADNPYLQMRGYPGTHDVSLGLDVLTRLKVIHTGDSVRVPRYDKSAFGGRGDRRPPEDWTAVPSAHRVFIFEGWMLGFRAVPSSQIADKSLRVINSFLPEYEVWYRQLDSFVHLDPLDNEFVLRWRVEAEQNMRKTGSSGMSDEQAQQYVRAFLPAYRTYLPGLRELPLTRGSQVRVQIDQDRLPQPKK